VNANQADAKVATMCRVLGLSTSSYYDWLDRAPSARSIDDAVLVERIRQIPADSDTTYGRPRGRRGLRAQGRVVNAKRIARLMRAHAMRGVSRRRSFVVTTRRDKTQDKCELMDRRSWPTKAQARMALFTWSEALNNPRRRHSALDYDSPIDFEARHRQQARKRQDIEHGLPTVGACVACATPPVDNPAPVLTERTEDLST